MALPDKPGDTTQYFLAREGRIPREAFFSPTNLERLLATTAFDAAA